MIRERERERGLGSVPGFYFIPYSACIRIWNTHTTSQVPHGSIADDGSHVQDLEIDRLFIITAREKITHWFVGILSTAPLVSLLYVLEKTMREDGLVVAAVMYCSI